MLVFSLCNLFKLGEFCVTSGFPAEKAGVQITKLCKHGAIFLTHPRLRIPIKILAVKGFFAARSVVYDFSHDENVLTVLPPRMLGKSR
jgi:hypothetical protein